MMDTIVFFLAQGTSASQAPRPSRPPPVSLGGPETGTILAIAGVLGLVLFLWAFFIRKRKHPDPHMRVLEESPLSGRNNGKSGHGKHGRKRRHRRTHSRDLPRNPTLQETGGLPPPRPEGEAPKF